jgi:hypothetical protein
VIQRSELRLALTTGLVNGLASLSPLPFGIYAPMAVLAVSGGTYGTSMELGRQRILGSILGMAMLLLGLRGLRAVPMPLALALILGALRLLGGALGLRVGYKVGGMIVVMGWLAHEEELGAWVPLRLFWTLIGILASLLSLRLLWPSRSGALAREALAELFDGLARDLDAEARALNAGAANAKPMEAAHAERQSALQRLRGLLPALTNELGDQPERHPAYQLVESLEEAASRLQSAGRSLSGLPPARHPKARRLAEGEAALLGALANRLRLWVARLSEPGPRWPSAPATPFTPPPPWLELDDHIRGPELNALPPRELERLAARLTLCRQALHAIEGAERSWAAWRPPSRR